MEKSLDYKGRWRNHTVAFRVSDEEAKLLNDLVALSGLTKQDYITRRILCRDVVVQGNPRVYKALKNQMAVNAMDKADKRVMESIRSREPFCEPFIKLSMILKTGGIEAEGYLGMCGDRISDALLIDGEDVRIDFVNFPDMELTAAGVRMCRDILECYVSGDIVSDAYVALMEEKSVRVHVNTISQTLREMKLCGLASAFIKSDARIRRFVVTEIWQRSILIRCFRKVRSAYYGILVQLKYHGLLSAVGRIAADAATEGYTK